MHPQLCNALNDVNNFITLQKQDRSVYTNDYDTIRTFLINKMMENDEIFKRMCFGCRLAGSYADNIKVWKPNEFDVVIHLKIIERDLVKIVPDKKLPGYVKLNLTDVFNKIKTEKQNQKLYDHLSKLVDSNNYLIIKKIQGWFESIITKIVQQNLKFTRTGVHYTLNYRKCGPAHTIAVKADWREFSIDFVPVFIFDKEKWVSPVKIPPFVPRSEAIWSAVPKPDKKNSTNGNNLSLITSYADIERHLIANKNNLKNTLRMLKKIRDIKGLNNLKSYYIKTVFLLENEIKSESFWDQPVSIVLKHMFERLLAYFSKGNLPFFWDRKFNMLSNLDANQIGTLHSQLNSVYTILWKTTDTLIIYSIFLKSNEIEQLKRSENSHGPNEDCKQIKKEPSPACVLQ